LIEHGADVNARAAIDSEGFGGHTTLFHTTATLVEKEEMLAGLLLQLGANPNLRATFRKRRRMGAPEKEKMCEYHDVTAMIGTLRKSLATGILTRRVSEELGKNFALLADASGYKSKVPIKA
jgi:hypothetical protein